MEREHSEETRIEIIEGIQFERGYLSPDFVTKGDKPSCVFENTYILLCPKTISSYDDIIPLLEKIATSGRPLLILAEDVRDTALDTILVNVRKQVIECAAVKLPFEGNRRAEMLEDIAIKTGAKIISSVFGFQLHRNWSLRARRS